MRLAPLGDALRAHPLAAVWSVLSLVGLVASMILLASSEWFPRALPVALQTLLLGGILPAVTARRREEQGSGERTVWILWNFLLAVGAVAALVFLRGHGGLPFAGMATLFVLLAFLFARGVLKRPVVACVLYAAACSPGFLLSTLPAADGAHPEGRRLFSTLGCALCHAPESGLSLQGIPNKLESLLSPNNEAAVASPREWLYLHLFAPEAFPGRSRGRICPPYRSLFVWRKTEPGARAPWALPVISSEGKELVPTADARHLADYLLSLRVPSTGLSNREAVLAQGETLFRAKCAACHGRDGQGDSLNYPPLDDPQWLNLPAEEYLNIIKEGKKGPITVHGRTWDGVMLPPGVSHDRDAEAIRQYLLDRFDPKR